MTNNDRLTFGVGDTSPGFTIDSWARQLQLVTLNTTFGALIKVETPYHDNDLILTPIISPQSGW